MEPAYKQIEDAKVCATCAHSWRHYTALALWRLPVPRIGAAMCSAGESIPSPVEG